MRNWASYGCYNRLFGRVLDCLALIYFFNFALKSSTSLYFFLGSRSSPSLLESYSLLDTDEELELDDEAAGWFTRLLRSGCFFFCLDFTSFSLFPNLWFYSCEILSLVASSSYLLLLLPYFDFYLADFFEFGRSISTGIRLSKFLSLLKS